MKNHFLALLLAFVLTNTLAYSQDIYSKAYGNPEDPAIIYIHGGPRGNATLFEGTTAASLASKGFYVIAYDRRGEGRSIDSLSKFTFLESINDLDEIIKKYKLKKTSIIGHSFGGIFATLYTAARPEKVERMILVGALFSQQETYDHIITSTKKIAMETKDTAALNQILSINSFDRKSAEYRKRCYELASRFHYFSMPFPTMESKKLQLAYQNSEYGRTNIRNDQAPMRFYKNEKQVNIDTRQTLKKIRHMNIKLFGIYGKQYRIFSNKQLSDIQQIIGYKCFDLIDNCSHYPFVDQQQQFIDDIAKFMTY